MPFFKKQLTPTSVMTETVKPLILLVDDEPDNLQVLSAILAQDYDLLLAHNGQEALNLIRTLSPSRQLNLVISDQRMPEMTGVQLCEHLCDIAPNTLRIIITGYIDIDTIVEAINRASLYQFIIKPFERRDFELLIKRAIEAYDLKRSLDDYVQNLEVKVEQRTRDLEHSHKQLQEAYSQLKYLSITDRLTGLYNRHYLHSVINKDLALMKRATNRHASKDASRALKLAASESTEQTTIFNQTSNHDLLFFMIDCDHFKNVNDQYGHDVGDKLLCAIANVLRQVFRESDYLIRWGGEEFLVVARFFPRQQAPELAERLRQTIEKMELPLGEGCAITCSCSIGYAVLPSLLEHHANIDWQGVVKLADYAMYCAKNSGRNTWIGLCFTPDWYKPFPASIQNHDIQRIIASGELEIDSAKAVELLQWK